MQSLHDWSVLAGPRLFPACKSRSFPLLTTCVNIDGKWVATRQTRLVMGVNMIRGPLCLPCTHCVQGLGSVLGVAKRATAALNPLPTSSANMAGKGPSKTSLEGGRNALQISDERARHASTARGVCAERFSACTSNSEPQLTSSVGMIGKRPCVKTQQISFLCFQHVAAVCIFQTLHESSVLAVPLPPQLGPTLWLPLKPQHPSSHTPKPVFVNISHTLNTQPSIPFSTPKPQTPISHQHTTQLSLQTVGYCWCAAGHRSSSWVG